MINASIPLAVGRMLARTAPRETPWLAQLRKDLHAQITFEMEVTVQIAVCTAAKMNRGEIMETLGCTELDVKMAMQRLQGVADTWRD